VRADPVNKTLRKGIAGAGYPEVKSDDKVRAAEALGLFINDTVACLDVRR
jgi:hypothetical protein